MAGGRGTRMGKLSETTPKALIKIGKKAIIERQILLLEQNGIKNIYVLLGYLGDKIEKYLGNGKKFGVKIYYCREKLPLGTAGSLKEIEKKIEKDFLFLSCDVMLDMDIKRFINWHNHKKNSCASLVVHPSDHAFDSDLVETDKKERVISFLIRPHSPSLVFKNLSIASVFIFSPKIFSFIEKCKKSDIEKDVLPKILAAEEKIYAYKSPEYIKDAGTPERLKIVRRDYNLGKIKKLNLKNKRKAIFLDRDGVINGQSGRATMLENFRLYNFSAEAIKEINNSDYLAIIITNQPAIAKGFISEEELFLIHKRMETSLAVDGAKIDAIYFCPHHPEKGFEGEIKELKIRCDCRKPTPGMIKKAEEDFNLDLNKCFFIGDSTTDAKTAENAKIKFIGVKTGYACQDKSYKISKKLTIEKNLLCAVKKILK